MWDTIRTQLLGKIQEETLINLHIGVFVVMHFLQRGSEIRTWDTHNGGKSVSTLSKE
jgi:hypothetical protein